MHRVEVATTWRGVLLDVEHFSSVEAIQSKIPLPPFSKGEIKKAVRIVESCPRAPVRVRDFVDFAYLKILTLVALLQLLLFIGIYLTPKLAKSNVNEQQTAQIHEIVLPHHEPIKKTHAEKAPLQPRTGKQVALQMLHHLGLNHPMPGGLSSHVGLLHAQAGGGNPALLGFGGQGKTLSIDGVSGGNEAVFAGGLSREEIQRVIDRTMGQMKYCYEREIQKSPDLEGKLLTRFTISPDGTVATSDVVQNTMHNAQVAACVQRIISRMAFPKPRGGGVVAVTYPFLFSQVGA